MGSPGFSLKKLSLSAAGGGERTLDEGLFIKKVLEFGLCVRDLFEGDLDRGDFITHEPFDSLVEVNEEEGERESEDFEAILSTKTIDDDVTFSSWQIFLKVNKIFIKYRLIQM